MSATPRSEPKPDIMDFELTLTVREIRSIKAEVWDEAYQAGAYDTLGSPRDAQENPYREVK